MTSAQLLKLAPFFWIGAGVMFFVAAVLAKQVAFSGVGAFFVVVGVAAMIRARKAGQS